MDFHDTLTMLLLLENLQLIHFCSQLNSRWPPRLINLSTHANGCIMHVAGDVHSVSTRFFPCQSFSPFSQIVPNQAELHNSLHVVFLFKFFFLVQVSQDVLPSPPPQALSTATVTNIYPTVSGGLLKRTAKPPLSVPGNHPTASKTDDKRTSGWHHV